MPHDHPLGHFHDHGHGAGSRHEELRTLAASFIDVFRAAADKTRCLRIAGGPIWRPGGDRLTLNPVDAAITSNRRLGSASLGFATRELACMAFPGDGARPRDDDVHLCVAGRTAGRRPDRSAGRPPDHAGARPGLTPGAQTLGADCRTAVAIALRHPARGSIVRCNKPGGRRDR